MNHDTCCRNSDLQNLLSNDQVYTTNLSFDRVITHLKRDTLKLKQQFFLSSKRIDTIKYRIIYSGTINLFSMNYLDLPMALVSLWVPPAPGIVPAFQTFLKSAVLEKCKYTNCDLWLAKFSFLSSIDDVTHHGHLIDSVVIYQIRM